MADSINTLDDNTRLVLEIANGQATFKSRELVYDVKEIENNKNTIKFVNLDSVWYGLVRDKGENEEFSHDNLTIVDGMNNFVVNPNPYGENIFDAEFKFGGQSWDSFNQYVKQRSLDKEKDVQIHRIVENKFYHNTFEHYSQETQDLVGSIIPNCKYLLCMDTGLYGLVPMMEDGKF